MASVTKNRYECIVIGGGIAGSTAAYHLAKAGYHAAVLEKTHGPHHKVCGEFLSFEALFNLKEMGIYLNENIPLVKHFQLFSPRSSASFTFPFPGRGISRYKLDEELLNNVKDAGADVFRGTGMRSYHKEENGLFRIETNEGDFYARHLFMAIGKHDYSKEHKRRGKDNSYIGFKTHLRLKSLGEQYQETTALFSFPGGYGGICPVEGGVMNFCFVIDKGIYKSLNSNFNEALAFLRRSNPSLGLVLQEADFVETFCAVGYIPYGFLCPPSNHDNVYFVGDQRMVIPSLTGDGMAIALSTARRCVQEFDCRQKGLKIQMGPMQKMLEKQMRWALTGHAILKYPWATDMCRHIPRLRSFLIETIFEKTRISIMEDIHDEPPSAAVRSDYSRR
jgi:flavin-dependent dehydrogenase